MKYAIISDIHSNIQALESVLQICDQEKVQKIICLGDVVGYNANPVECLKLAQERFSRCIKGNHDDLAVREISFHDSMDWSHDALKGISYTKSQISSEDQAWLKTLKLFDIVNDRKIHFAIGHGIPFPLKFENPFKYVFADSGRYLMKSFKYECKNARLGFFGHTHIPTIIKGYKDDPENRFTMVDMGSYILDEGEALLDVNLGNVISGEEYLMVNPGSVGQPRGDCPNSFVILDTIKGRLQFRKFEYDVESAKNAILSAGYHDRLAKRLDPILRF